MNFKTFIGGVIATPVVIVAGVLSVPVVIVSLPGMARTAYFETMAPTWKKEQFAWATDEDDRSRSCKIIWYKRNIGGASHHWAFTFDWGDYEATYEGIEKGGYLIPNWYKGGPEPVPSMKGNGTYSEWKKVNSFQVICSPKKVNKAARNVEFNGAKYKLTVINCHLWAGCLAKAFGIKDIDLDRILDTLVPFGFSTVVDGLNSSRVSIKEKTAGSRR